MGMAVNRTTLEYLFSVNTPDYDPEDWLVWSKQTRLPTTEELRVATEVQRKYRKIVNDFLEEMTAGEKDAVDAAESSAIIAAAKQFAKEYYDRLEAENRALRALVMLTVDELNILRTRDRDRSADVAAATNLANLQTRWAARSALNDRTYQQAKTAIEAIIDGE